jgi:hypothetical protein
MKWSEVILKGGIREVDCGRWKLDKRGALGKGWRIPMRRCGEIWLREPVENIEREQEGREGCPDTVLTDALGALSVR